MQIVYFIKILVKRAMKPFRSIKNLILMGICVALLAYNSYMSHARKQLIRTQIERPAYAVNCQNVFEFDETEIRSGQTLLSQLRANSSRIPTLPDENFIFNASMCRSYLDTRRFGHSRITEFERRFPIAFSILTYDNVEQFERFFRVIYRPQNVYCIH